MKDFDIYYVVEMSGVGIIGIYKFVGTALYSMKITLQEMPCAKISIESKMLDSDEYESLLTTARNNYSYVESIINE